MPSYPKEKVHCNDITYMYVYIDVFDDAQLWVKLHQWHVVAICLLVILFSDPTQWAFQVSRKTPSCGSKCCSMYAYLV